MRRRLFLNKNLRPGNIVLKNSRIYPRGTQQSLWHPLRPCIIVTICSGPIAFISDLMMFLNKNLRPGNIVLKNSRIYPRGTQQSLWHPLRPCIIVTICSGPIAFISDLMSHNIYNCDQFDAPQHS